MMKRLFLFAAVAGFTLVSAHPPQDRERGRSHDEDAYPPCSRTVRDSCIQLHERGIRRDRHAAHRDHDAAMAHRGGHASHARMASRCAVRCVGHRRVMAARVRRAGERG